MRRTREQLNADNARLRASVGGDSQFMRAHKIKKDRTALPRRVVPVWTLSDEGVGIFLRTKFPLILGRTNNSFRQFMRARRQWQKAFVYNKVIYLFYRCHMTEGEIADELKDVFRRMGRKNAIDAVRDTVKVVRKYKPYGS
jgi:hypothetical protein